MFSVPYRAMHGGVPQLQIVGMPFVYKTEILAVCFSYRRQGFSSGCTFSILIMTHTTGSTTIDVALFASFSLLSEGTPHPNFVGNWPLFSAKILSLVQATVVQAVEVLVFSKTDVGSGHKLPLMNFRQRVVHLLPTVYRV